MYFAHIENFIDLFSNINNKVFNLNNLVLAFLAITSIILGLTEASVPLIIIKFALIIINALVIKYTNIFILTKKGLTEYKKVAMLKNYLKDYSLINDRDIDSVIVYDDYLVYATAFGIPNVITSKLDEFFMNLNITLQFINTTI